VKKERGMAITKSSMFSCLDAESSGSFPYWLRLESMLYFHTADPLQFSYLYLLVEQFPILGRL
jgi:hypothetical protein